MNAQPLVSIVTASFNSARTIARTLDSVLAQTYRNIEVIVIDGGSTDSTVSIIESFVQKFDGRLKWISEQDKGMYDAMNKGIERSTGELIGILNSDDWYEPDAVETMVKVYSIEQSSVLYGILRYVDAERETMLYRMHHDSLKEGMITHPTCFVPRSLYKKYGMFDLKYRLSSDYDLMLRFQSNGVTFVPVDRIIANFSAGGLSTVNTNGLIEGFRIRHSYGIISDRRMKWGILKLQIKAMFKKLRISL
jgi:glycosyltransferase involved in cell wall biosynthesis